jgi:hypothetical protein
MLRVQGYGIGEVLIERADGLCEDLERIKLVRA